MVQPERAATAGTMDLQPFERGRKSLLAAPLAVAPGVHVVLELFDKGDGVAFNDGDQRLVSAAADFGAEILRHALAEQQTQRVLVDAVASALETTRSMTASLGRTAAERLEEPPPADVLRTLRAGLNANPGAAIDADEALRLAEAVRVLALRHGPPAVRHCTQLVNSLRQLLDTVTGTGE